jgi:hypothetical protein
VNRIKFLPPNIISNDLLGNGERLTNNYLVVCKSLANTKCLLMYALIDCRKQAMHLHLHFGLVFGVHFGRKEISCIGSAVDNV